MPDQPYPIEIGGGAQGHERSLQQLVNWVSGYGVNNPEYQLPFKPVYDGSGYLIDGNRPTVAGGTLRLLSNGVNHLTLAPSGATSSLIWTVGSLVSSGNIIAGGNVVAGGNLVVAGNTTLGTNDVNTLTVNASSTFQATVLANVGITTNLLNVVGAAHFYSPVVMDSTLSVAGATSLAAVSASGAATFSSTVGITGAATLQSTLNVAGAASFASTLQVDSDSQMGNGNGDLHTVIGIARFRNAAGTTTQLYVDAGNNRVIVGSGTALGSDTAPNLQVIGRAYFAPDAANDFAIQVRRSSAASVGWNLGMTSDNDFVFKDDAGSETFRVGDTSSTYQAKVTGDFNVTDDAVFGGDVSGDRVAAGTTTYSGSEKLRVSGQSRLEGAVTITTGGLGVTGSSAFNNSVSVTGGVTINSGGLSVAGGVLIDAASSNFANITNPATVAAGSRTLQGYVQVGIGGSVRYFPFYS